jgi:hypothetical protein
MPVNSIATLVNGGRAMTEDEQKLLRTASEAIMQLVRDRDGRLLQLRDDSLRSGETRLPMTATPPVNPPPQY